MILTLLYPATALAAMPVGCGLTAVQMLFPNQVRGQATALYILILNFGSLTLGPLLPALFNDYLFKNEAMLGASMSLATLVAAVVSAVILAAAFASYRRDHALTESRTAD